ncbi:tim-barrel domain-containing protein [Gamsiella multidivaricata]|uniref:tim-barrel domain-containing protein n=1 Tax=Gamsiella multidivaricata TaxID=101098 RepID=UPI00221EE2AC|nr:tim-barrel domain-containing protein [Gamsiella multidivaricata]KAI7832676.1 tim-barrel domain-containing protein [Gamsiella multidivaricata]
MSWSGDRFSDMPTVPPVIDTAKGIIRASFVPWRYYMNVVTFGYSFVFWDWTRWERELDWMFLNGINMALAMVGQEYVFRQMYENLGLTREELNGFFAGPAYMPWQRMGNIQGSWGFPNDTQYKNDWIDSQWELQGHVMSRMNDLNITAVLPAFNGFVPRELTKKFPDVKFNQSSQWGFLEDPYSRNTFISSADPFFASMTKRFLQTQQSLYHQKGLESNADNQFYLLDLFNEMHPVCMETECLKQLTSEVMKALKAADPKAIWAMQSWFMLPVVEDIWHEQEIKAFFDGIRTVNDGRDAFVIDLYSDVAPLWNVTQGFFGIDWGWSMLNNFGGGQALYGTLPTLLTEPFKGYQEPAKAMRGMGITMEGINNNEYLYQLILDIPWDQPPLDGQKHLEAYLKRRYGPNQTSDAVLEAWTTLSQTVWDCSRDHFAQPKSYLDLTPALEMNRTGFLPTIFDYNQAKVVRAWTQFVQSTETETSQLPLNVSSFRYDLVDVTREIMAAIVIPGLHHELVDAYKAKDLARTRYWGRLILEAIKDTDRILGTHTHFMLGPWIRDARLAAKTASSSTSSRYQNYVEHSARNQITWWVPAGQQGLADYAGKQWSGLVKEFYYPRWKIFVDRLVTAAQKGRQLDYKAYLADSLKVESVWLKQTTCLGSSHGSRCSSKHTFALEPVEDTVIVAQDLWDRWNKIAARLAEKADKKA